MMADWPKKYSAIFSCVLLCGAAAEGQPVYEEEIEPYVAFLEQGQAEPVDYVMGLFEDYRGTRRGRF